jgi:hypothetical protein
MFGRNKPIVLSRGYNRRRKGLPAWLKQLLLGGALGAAGLWLVQEKMMAPRLSVGASNQLRADFEKADAERGQLKQQLTSATQQLQTAQATVQKQNADLLAPRAEAQKLRDELGALISALPADPRGGAVEVRAARFAPQTGAQGGNALGYDIILTRPGKDAAGTPFKGVLQFDVLGLTPRGAETRITLKPVDFSMGAQTLLRGAVAVPDSVRPSQVTLRVLDGPAGKVQGMRVLYVR